MARPSKVDRLPSELKSLIGQLRQDGCTVDEILAKLREMKPDIDISRSGLHVHVQKKVDAVLDTMNKTRAIAQAVSAKIDSASQTEVARLNVELMHGLIFKLVTESEDGGDVTIDAKEVSLLSRALRSLNAGSKTMVDMEIKVREEMAKKTVAAAERAIDASGAPDKAELLRRIREDVYGIVG